MRAVFPFIEHMAKKKNLLSYRLHGHRAWGPGYFEYKWEQIAEALKDPEILSTFRNGNHLPEKFGARIDERIVEYPWLLSRIPEEPGRLLDAGSALNFETLIAHPKLADKKMTIINLNPEPNCFWKRSVSYAFEDIRALPFLFDTFDLVTCISTLEHVGMDNTSKYTNDSAYNEMRPDDYLSAIAELRRVLKPRGTLYLTVPFGTYGNFGFFQQFNSVMLERVRNAFGGKSESAFYRYMEGGWDTSTEEECTSATYTPVDRARKDPRLPVAAEAVACLMLTK